MRYLNTVDPVFGNGFVDELDSHDLVESEFELQMKEICTSGSTIEGSHEKQASTACTLEDF